MDSATFYNCFRVRIRKSFPDLLVSCNSVFIYSETSVFWPKVFISMYVAAIFFLKETITILLEYTFVQTFTTEFYFVCVNRSSSKFCYLNIASLCIWISHWRIQALSWDVFCPCQCAFARKTFWWHQHWNYPCNPSIANAHTLLSVLVGCNFPALAGQN